MTNECTSAQLVEALKEPNVVHVVLLYGKTCGPCVRTKPNYEMVENFFSKLRPEVKFHQIDVWSEDGKPFKEHTAYESVPTYVIYNNGMEIARDKGYKETLQIKDFVFKSLE